MLHIYSLLDSFYNLPPTKRKLKTLKKVCFDTKHTLKPYIYVWKTNINKAKYINHNHSKFTLKGHYFQ